MSYALEAQIERAEDIVEQVRQEERSRSELVHLADVVEEEQYRSLRTSLRDIDELAAKIEERGQLVPILVWLRRGRYVLLSGHRRVAALRSLGATMVKAIVYADRDLSERDALDIAIDDNVDRNNFSKAEMAGLVTRLVERGMTQRNIARRLRLSNGTVSDYFRLASAPQDVKDAVDRERVALRAGLRLASESEDVRARALASSGPGMLSLRDVERLLGRAGASRSSSRRPAKRGAAWSRETSAVTGLAWQRERENEREIRVRLPANPTPEQRVALRSFLLAQVRSL